MLTFLRDNATKWMVKAVLWTLVAAFVGTIFLVWGYGNEGGERPVAKVGSYSITQAEYRRYYENMLRRLQEMAGGQFSQEMAKQMHLDRSALEGLIMEKLQLKAAKDAGMEASDEEVRRDIDSTPAFQRNGAFDRDAYFAALRQSGLAPREYEKMLRQDIAVRKLAQIITDGVQVTDMEVRDAFIRDNMQVKARYFEILPAAYTGEALRNADKVLEEYFKANGARFMRPETRSVQLVSADPALFAAAYVPTDADARAYFEQHRAEFRRDAKVKARHLLLKVADNAPAAESDAVRKEAEELYARAKKGEDFAALARKYSQDPGSAKSGGDLGWFGRGQMVPEFEAAAFSMEKGDLSAPVRTKFGYHLIKLEQSIPGGEMRFEEALPAIRGILTEGKGDETAKRKILAALGDAPGKDLKTLAKEQGLQYQEMTLAQGEVIRQLPDSAKVVERVFNTKEGEVNGPVQTMGGYYLLKVTKVAAPAMPKLAEVRAEVEKAYVKEKSARLAADAARNAAQRLNKGEPMAAVARGMKVRESKLLKRGDALEGVDGGALAAGAAFALNVNGADQVQTPAGFVVLQVTERREPTLEEYETQRAPLREAILSRKRQEAVIAWQTALRERADKDGIVTINETFE